MMSTNFLFSKVSRQLPAMFCLYTSNILSRPKFEFSLKVKVVRSNPGYLLKHFLFYLKDETIDIVMARAATRGKTSEMEENGDSSSGTW